MSVVPALPEATEPAPAASPGSEDLLGVRSGAALIDLAVLFVLAIVLSVAIGDAWVGGGGFSFRSDSAGGAALYYALVFVYYFALEATIGQTVGKLLVGLRVVGRDGGRPSVAAVAIRTLLRVVDWLPLLYLVGFIAMLATGARQQRLGDLAARTGIARAAPIRHRGRAVAAVTSTLVLVVAGSVVYVAASDGGAKTYRGHGVSFDYPAGWTEGSMQSEEANALWGRSFAVGKYDAALVGAYQLNASVTAENLDLVIPELDEAVRQFAEQSGGAVWAGPEYTGGSRQAHCSVPGDRDRRWHSLRDYAPVHLRRHDRVLRQLPTHRRACGRDRTGLRADPAYIQGGSGKCGCHNHSEPRPAAG
jgi:uncharacterized RDD family membrane protein YckC